MKGQCEKCGQAYAFETENVKGFSAVFRCQACDHIIKVADDNIDRRPFVPLENLESPEPGAGPINKSNAILIIKPEDLEYGDQDGVVSSKSDKQPFVALEALEYKTNRGPASPEEYKKKQSSQWIIAAIIAVLAILAATMIANFKKRDSLRLEMEKRLNAAIAEKVKKHNAFFEKIEEEVKQAADYLKNLYENPNPPGDNGMPLLLPWDGKQYGNDEIRRRFQNEILIQKTFSVILKETVRYKPYIDLAYSGTQTNISAFSNDDVIRIIENTAPGILPSKRPWYTKAETAGKLIWTDLYAEANQRQLSVSCAMPVILSDKRIPAVVGFDVNLSDMQKDLLAMDFGYDARVFLINNDGKILFKSQAIGTKNEFDKMDNLFKTGNSALFTIGLKMAKGETGLATYKDTNNKKKYLAYGSFPAIRASVGIIVSKSEIK